MSAYAVSLQSFARARVRAPRRPAAALAAPTWAANAETAGCVLILLMMSQALLGRLGDPEQTGQGAAWLRLMWLPVDAAIFGLAARRWRDIRSLGLGAALCIAAAVWAVASTAWSLDLDITLRRSIGLLCSCLFGLYLAARYSWPQLIRMIAVTALILAAGSLVAGLLFPGFGVQPDSSAWRGLWFEKNAMGGFMARGAIACLCVCAFRPQKPALWIGGAALCALLALLSTSTTAALALGLGLATLAVLAMIRRGSSLAMTGVVAALSLAACLALVWKLQPELLYAVTGKDASLTGRADLWAAVWREVAHRPLTGYGYGAFWSGQTGPSAEVRAAVNWNARNADNGWLDMLAQLGAVGVALIALPIGFLGLKTLPKLRQSPEAYWLAGSIVVLLVTAFSESVLLRANDTVWVLLVATAAKLATAAPRPVVKQKRRRTTLPVVAPKPISDPLGAAASSALWRLSIAARALLAALNEGRRAEAVNELDAMPAAWRSFSVLWLVARGSDRYAHPVIRGQAVVEVLSDLKREIGQSAALGEESSLGAISQQRAEVLGRILDDLSRAEIYSAMIDAGVLEGPAHGPASREAVASRLQIASGVLARLAQERVAARGIPSLDSSQSAWLAVRDMLERAPARTLLSSVLTEAA